MSVWPDKSSYFQVTLSYFCIKVFISTAASLHMLIISLKILYISKMFHCSCSYQQIEKLIVYSVAEKCICWLAHAQPQVCISPSRPMPAFSSVSSWQITVYELHNSQTQFVDIFLCFNICTFSWLLKKMDSAFKDVSLKFHCYTGRWPN